LAAGFHPLLADLWSLRTSQTFLSEDQIRAQYELDPSGCTGPWGSIRKPLLLGSKKTGPLSDRLSQVEMDRVFGSHRLTLLVEGMARPEDHPVKAYPLFLNILTAM